MDLKQVLTDIARAIVDTPDAVNVIEKVDGDNVELTLIVAEDDTGMVIGRHGKIAKAIRQVACHYAVSLNGVFIDPKNINSGVTLE